jgi:Cd2+/Zn2+-exporting ATPase
MDLKQAGTENLSWIPGLAAFLQNQEGVEAIMIDSKDKKVSIATLGKVDESILTYRLQQTLREIEKSIAEHTVSNVPAGNSIKVHYTEGKTFLKKPSCLTAPRFWQWREVPWPEVDEHHEHHHSEEWQKLAFFSVVCGIGGALGAYLARPEGNPLVSKICFGVSLVAGGWEAAQEAFKQLPKGKLDIHFLMLAVALGSCAIGAWKEGALLLFLFSLSGTMEHFALSRTHKAIDSLFKNAPKTALLLEDGKEQEVPSDKLEPKDIIICKPGDVFPIDGEIILGTTAADESNLTGEANPIPKEMGSQVYSGTVNLWGRVHVKVEKPAQESALQRIIYLIQEAQHLKAPSQRFTDKFGTPYTYGILGLTIVSFFVWWLGLGVPAFYNTPDCFSAFYRAMTLLVVSSPCALVLSIPSAILAAIAWGAQNGILFRGGAAIEKLCQVNLVALDKTGTLTTGNLAVHKIESFPEGREANVAELAFCLENNSKHPIARAINAYSKAKGLNIKTVDNFQSLTGKGVKGHIDNVSCVIGRRELLELGPLAKWVQDLPQPPEMFTEVWVVYGDLLGRILLKDEIRKQSKPVLEALKDLGIRTLMLTGDRRNTAEAVAKAIGIQEVHAGLTPEDKVNTLRDFTKQGYKVAMVGDGVNDGPSLAAAYVPVAMGARGSDVALELSEVILMNDRIDHFLKAYKLSVRAKKIIYQNLTIALTTISLMALASLTGLVPLSIGVFAHEGSTVLVCLNSLRLLWNRFQ